MSPKNMFMTPRKDKAVPGYNRRFKETRIGRGYTAKTLAEAIGFTHSLVVRVENLKVIPNESLREKLSEVLEKSVDYLFPKEILELTKLLRVYYKNGNLDIKLDAQNEDYYPIHLLDEKELPLNGYVSGRNRLSYEFDGNLELLMGEAFKRLDKREIRVIKKYFGFYGDSQTLEEISKNGGVNRGKINKERVHQIKKKALNKLRPFFNSHRLV